MQDSLSRAFEQRKQKILHQISVPASSYKDLSPKGTIDEGIRRLIDDINAQEGLVTTSSCAGRISVFVEGWKKDDDKASPEDVLGPSRSEYGQGGL